ncbi:MAG: hypothetical protein HYY01_05400 [Chloroflexi bacterium]|nr:hypothetical protein [Chloroflexota bacterium]
MRRKMVFVGTVLVVVVMLGVVGIVSAFGPEVQRASGGVVDQRFKAESPSAGVLDLGTQAQGGGGVRSVDDKVQRVSATYVRRYSSLADLANEATLIVRGRVVQEGDSYPVGDGFPFTDVVFRVDQVLLGDNAVAGTLITVGQTGGRGRGGLLELELEPLMRAGEEFVLFLHPWWGLYPEKMYSVGSYAGRFRIDNGAVWRSAPEEVLSRAWNGRPAADLEAAIKGLRH